MDSLAEQYMREHFARMREIDDRAVGMTTGLAVFNARQIFHLSNAVVHPSARLPSDQINELTELVVGKADV